MQVMLLRAVLRKDFKLMHSNRPLCQFSLYSINYTFILKSLTKKPKKEAFKCPWEDCNFLRHDWSNHTVRVYHNLWFITCAHH